MHSAWLTPPYVFLWVPQLCALAFLALIVRFDRRSLWSGFALFVFIMTVGVTAACLFVDTMDLVPSQWIRTVMLWIGLLAAAVIVAFPVLLGVFLTAEGCRLLRREGVDLVPSQWIRTVMLWIGLLAAAVIVAFPVLLGVFLTAEGCRLLRREGVSPANCLSLAAGLFVLLDLTLIPYLASLVRNAVVTWLFALASACVLFFSAQLAIYCLSAFVNLVHVGRARVRVCAVLLRAARDLLPVGVRQSGACGQAEGTQADRGAGLGHLRDSCAAAAGQPHSHRHPAAA